MQGLANQIAAFGWDVGIVFAEDLGLMNQSMLGHWSPSAWRETLGDKGAYHQQLALDIAGPLQTIVVLALG